MAEMVERVARAMYEAYHSAGRRLHDWDRATDKFEREQWRITARAAIEAMRKPSDDMMEAAAEAALAHEPAQGSDAYMRLVWAGAIAAALAEGEEG